MLYIKVYLFFSKIAFPNSKVFYYVGDNTKKDFVTPNKLGWKTICLKDQGKNIHKQNLRLGNKYLPMSMVDEFQEIIKIV